MKENDMADQDSRFEADWEQARARLFPAVVPPTRAETEAFTRRVMARIPAEAGFGWPVRWLAPALALSAAALFLSLALPVIEEDSAEPFLLAAAPSDAEDLLGFSLEDR